MSSVNRPKGFTPVQRRDGLPYAGAFRQFQIQSGNATPIGFGDPVALDANGFLTRAITATSGTVSTISNAIGIFVGCQYTDPSLKYLLNTNGYVGGVVANDIMGYVVDDPAMIFEVQADGPLLQTNLGNNIGVIAAAPTGLDTNLVSRLVVAAATSAAGAGATTLPFRIVDFKRGPDSRPGDAFTEVLVAWNMGQHLYTGTNGV